MPLQSRGTRLFTVAAFPSGWSYMLDAVARQDVLAEYNILDTVPEPEYDDIASVAQRVCETKVALVSLVGRDRQWFKARVGFPLCETPLDQSVCVHALQADDLLVIGDLTKDKRTKHNPLVTGEPFIRFYAGAVLRNPEGDAFGSLCVVDDKPRPDGLTENQSETLLALARQVVTLMSFRLAVNNRDEALARERRAAMVMRMEGKRQVEAQQIGGIGTFEIDVKNDRLAVSNECRRILGLPRDEELTIEDFKSVTVDAREAHHTTAEMRSEGSARREVEYRIRRRNDGGLRWIVRRTGFRTDAQGDVERMVGTVQDITERKQSELRTRALIDLGDTLRDAEDVKEAVGIAARLLGEALSASRAGYALIDLAANSFRVEQDWTAPGQASIAGTYSIDDFRSMVSRVSQGSPVIVANVPAAAWLAADAAGHEALGIKALICVPLLRHGQLSGVLFAHSASPRTWTASETDFAVSVADRAYATVARIEAEHRQRVLNDELSHRLKNTLSMVQGIVSQTLRGLPDREPVKALQERIITLSKAHDVLLQQSWSAARIAEVVEQVTCLHGETGAFKVAGPNILLGAKATLTLSLLLHEMATNAVKYGALSVAGGRVYLTWRTDRSGSEPLLALAWTETGGPPAIAPTGRGFGSRLISMGIAGAGRNKVDYTPDGLRATFEAPLKLVTEP